MSNIHTTDLSWVHAREYTIGVLPQPSSGFFFSSLSPVEQVASWQVRQLRGQHERPKGLGMPIAIKYGEIRRMPRFSPES